MTDPTNIPPDYEPLSLADAARRLGVSPNAVLQRRKRGTIHAVAVGPRDWLYYLPPVGSAWSAPVGNRSRSSDQRDHGDRDALVALLADLVKQNGELQAANATLAERLRQLQDGGMAVADGLPIPLAAGAVARHAETHADAPEPHAMMPDTIAAIPARPEPSTRIRRAWNVLRGRE